MTPGAHHLYPPRLGTLSREHPTHTQNASAWGEGAARRNAAAEVREAERGRCLLNPVVEGGRIWGGDTTFWAHSYNKPALRSKIFGINYLSSQALSRLSCQGTVEGGDGDLGG